MRRTPFVMVLVGLLMLQGRGATAQKSWNSLELWARKHESYHRGLPASPVFTAQQVAAQVSAASGLMAAIQHACRAGAGDYTIPPGNYRFNGLQPTILANLHPASGRFRVIARGVTFWFARPGADASTTTYGLELKNCVNVTIKGLSIDFDPVTWTQGQIVHINTVTHQMTVAIDQGYPLTLPSDGAVIQFFHSNGRYIPRLPSGLFTDEHAEVSNPLLRQVVVTLGKTDLNDDLNPVNHAIWKYHDFFHTGDCVVLPYRTAWALKLAGCDAVHIEHVGIYDSPGMGILEDGGPGHNVYDHVRIVRRPGTNRLYACCADGIHSRLTEHGPTIENCEISCNGDDIVNLHGYFALVVRQAAPDRIVVASYAEQSIRPGDTLSLYRFHRASRLAPTTVVSTSFDDLPADNSAATALAKRLHVILPNGPLHIVRISSPIACKPGTLINSHTNQAAGFVIKNCYFHDSPGRCLLLNGACNGIVTNNAWRNVQNGVCLHMESWYYLEGPFCHDITLEHNRWDHCDMGAPLQWSGVRGLIYAGMVPAGNYLRTGHPLFNLTIVGNHINHCGGAAICISNARDVQVSDNLISHPYVAASMMSNWQAADDYYQDTINGSIYFAECNGVIANRNRVLQPQASSVLPVVQVGRGGLNVLVNGTSRRFQQPITRDVYKLVLEDTGEDLVASGTAVALRHHQFDNEFAWLVTPVSGGAVTFSSISAITVYLACSREGGVVKVSAASGSSSATHNGRWYITKCRSGKYRISPVDYADLALQGNTRGDQPALVLRPWDGATAQQWSFTKTSLNGASNRSH